MYWVCISDCKNYLVLFKNINVFILQQRKKHIYCFPIEVINYFRGHYKGFFLLWLMKSENSVNISFLELFKLEFMKHPKTSNLVHPLKLPMATSSLHKITAYFLWLVILLIYSASGHCQNLFFLVRSRQSISNKFIAKYLAKRWVSSGERRKKENSNLFIDW